MGDQRTILQQRPDIEAISARYERMLAEVRDRLSVELGGLSWVKDDDGARRGCGFDFPDVPDGQSRSLGRWTALGGLPDDRWDQAVTVVQEVTAEHGFASPEVVVDQPGNHEMAVPDPYGGTLIFGTAANVILRMRTGCHLPPEPAVR